MRSAGADSQSDATDEKLQRQKDLEDRSLARGAHRFDQRLKKAREQERSTSQGATKQLLIERWPELSRAVRDWIEDKEGGRGRPHSALPWLKQVGPDQAATITMKTVLDKLHTSPPYGKVATEIADRIVMELRCERLQQEAPGLFKYRVQTLDESRSYAHLKSSMSATIQYSEVDISDLQMPENRKLILGTVLIDLFHNYVGLVRIANRETRRPSGGVKTQKFIEPSEDTARWISERNRLLRERFPVLSPMIVPPLRWGKRERGGYRYALRGEHKLVRGPKDSEQPKGADLTKVYRALNSIQETPWTINYRVLEVVKELADKGGGRIDIPRLKEIPVPEKPESEEDGQAIEEWQQEASLHRKQERQRRAEAGTFLKTLHTAEELADEEELYWPHNLDFRGRVYPLPDTLHPQGPDLHRGLLQFADPKKLGKDGAMWLAVHGANCIGVTEKGRKLNNRPFEERVNFILENTGRIRQISDAPLDNDWWRNADQPWQFLAFSFEWDRFMRHRARGEPYEEFLSWLPVSVDGSCNGLQHFSALLRDERGGAAVNLVPDNEPHDMYSRVLRATTAHLEEVADKGEEPDATCARLWLESGFLDRSLVKRPAMTFAYGSRQFGFSRQIQEHLRSERDWTNIRKYFTRKVGEQEDATDLTFKASSVLASAIWEAIGNEAQGAFETMEWLQQAARIVAKSGDDTGTMLSWEVPETGFQVTQAYRKQEKKQIETVLSGTVIQPCYYRDKEEVDSRKQANAAPPNVIHSLDAANLIMAVNRAAGEDVSHIGVVHDSFQTHAGDMTTLSHAIRETFVELHQHPILEDLEAQFRTQADDPDDIPEPPDRGNLDIGQVLYSRYFFS